MPTRRLLLRVGGLLGRRRRAADGRRRCGCGGRRRRRRGFGGAADCGGRCRRRRGRGRTGNASGALILHELHDPVDDQRDQDQYNDAPRDEHDRPAVPLDGLGLFLERIERSEWRGLIPRGWQRPRRRRGRPLSTDIDVPGRLIVELVGRAIGCHGTDRTDPARLDRVDLLDDDEPSWAVPERHWPYTTTDRRHRRRRRDRGFRTPDDLRLRVNARPRRHEIVGVTTSRDACTRDAVSGIVLIAQHHDTSDPFAMPTTFPRISESQHRRHQHGGCRLVSPRSAAIMG